MNTLQTLRAVLALAVVPLLLPAQRATPAETAAARVCEWDGWLPPADGRIRYQKAHPLSPERELALRGQLNSTRMQEREVAARMLEAGHEDATVTALLAHMNDANGVVRQDVIRSLGRIGSVRAETVLIDALADSSKHIRQAAAWSLGQLQSATAVPSLIMATQDTSEHVRSDAAWSLGAIGDARAVRRLRELAMERTEAVRLAAVCSLGWMHASIPDGGKVDSSAALRAAVRWARSR